MPLLSFDQTGALKDNLKTETHVVSSVNGVTHAFIVPDWAPFFAVGCTVFHIESGEFLVEGTDYELTDDFTEAFEKVGKPIFGSITLLDVNKTGTFKISLQSLGGDFVTSSTQAITNGFETLQNLQNRKWEDITSPPTFPLTFHTHPVTDVEGVTEIVNQFILIRQAIEAGNMDIKLEDIVNLQAGFIAPLLANLEAIRVAVAANAHNNDLKAYQSKIITNKTLSVTLGTWINTGLEATVDVAGTYLIDWDMLGTLNDPDGTVEVRWTLDNSAIADSYTKGIAKAIPKDTVVRLQVRALTAGSLLSVASVTHGALLNLLRISK